MKVLLLGDISHVGRKFDVKDVSDGYALNFLFPKGLAERATPERMRTLDADKTRLQSKRDEAERTIEAALKRHKKPIAIEAAANEKGHLFAAIHEKDIATAIFKQCDVEISPERIALKEAIHDIGSYSVTVRVASADMPLELHIVAIGSARS